ncbi:hypothetical protein I79_018527 [Cricetulus griseus]|uniref:Uncharacterized protein n=1 Tax=Cricetulus griseus TaxID=10029 RepID=G3I4Y6_CRIGR|nr:hypothetical protein I79_018527 [Cricetulus griseus]
MGGRWVVAQRQPQTFGPLTLLKAILLLFPLNRLPAYGLHQTEDWCFQHLSVEMANTAAIKHDSPACPMCS